MRGSRFLALFFTLALSLPSTAAVPEPVPAAVPNSATQALLVEKSNLQGMVSDNRLIALYGVPIATLARNPRSGTQSLRRTEFWGRASIAGAI